MLQAHYPREHFKDASRIFPLDNIGLNYYSIESRELPPRDNKNAFNYIAANYYYGVGVGIRKGILSLSWIPF